MSFSSNRYEYKTTPTAKNECIIKGDKYRFTVLTSRLIRAEYSETGFFEDRPTQTVINRNFPLVKFKVEEDDNSLIINTDNITLTYYKKAFDKNSLFIKYTGENSKVNAGYGSTVWMFGGRPSPNLGGTARTLDGVNGECELEDGIMSKGEVTMLDDSNSLIINSDGTISARDVFYTDVYLFCYGSAKNKFEYKNALKALYSLCGKTPLLPRFTLGNWWSRYYEYTQDEYINLIKKFKEEDIPFSVAVVDMDWHYVDIDTKYGSGWTGYSWNKNLFPNHKKFLNDLHNEGLTVSLNLHPQQGIAAHEDTYENMANAMGIDPKTEKTIEFDITDTRFIENYFQKVHHPLEEEGVDFWWMDWQQGNNSKVEGLDPLWMLNHYHYIDNGRGKNRPLMFSRYAGIGSHRYPIGFSGDTYMTWESLDFQPYFTATASNVGYGWWSHDIGGHMFGKLSGEMIARWVQLGVFSPINRLHSTKGDFMGKEPWNFNKAYEVSMKKFLKLRHELIPYLYAMNYRSANFDEPIVMPLYYNWSENEAYNHKNEYTFGSELIVMPITTPCDVETGLGNAKAYLPDGEWYDFFNNTRYIGKRELKVHRNIENMPVFAKAGAIIPMARLEKVNDINNPSNMIIKVFAGADNQFELYEDDGKTKDYLMGKSAITNITFNWGENASLIISAPIGDKTVIPKNRSFEVEFIGINNPDKIKVTKDNNEIYADFSYSNGVLKVKADSGFSEIKIELFSVKKCKNDVEKMIFNVLQPMETDNAIKQQIYNMFKQDKNAVKLLSQLDSLDISKNLYSSICEILTAEF